MQRKQNKKKSYEITQKTKVTDDIRGTDTTSKFEQVC